MVGVCVLMIIVQTLFIRCSKREADDVAQDARGIFGQVKMIMSYGQIMGAMPAVFTGVKWPLSFTAITSTFSVTNLDVFSGFGSVSCSMLLPELDKFTMHMFLPPMLLLSIGITWCLTQLLIKDATKRKERDSQIYKTIIFVTLLVYPGLCTRVFSVFRCVDIGGVDLPVMSLDYSVTCHEGIHARFAIYAIISLCLYVIGIPVAIFAALWLNKKHLHDKTSPKYEIVHHALGGLYESYEVSCVCFP